MPDVHCIVSSPCKDLQGKQMMPQLQLAAPTCRILFDFPNSSNTESDDQGMFSQVESAGTEWRSASPAEKAEINKQIRNIITRTMWWRTYSGGVKMTVKSCAQVFNEGCTLYLHGVVGGPITCAEHVLIPTVLQEADADLKAQAGIPARVAFLPHENVDELQTSLQQLAGADASFRCLSVPMRKRLGIMSRSVNEWLNVHSGHGISGHNLTQVTTHKGAGPGNGGWKGDNDLIFELHSFDGYYGIKVVQFGGWLQYSQGAGKRSPNCDNVSMYTKPGSPEHDADMRWMIDSYNGFYSIRHFQSNYYMQVYGGHKHTSTTHAVTVYKKVMNPEFDTDAQWIFDF
eukprot:TRINITY_DN26519_c0_g8_i1.p1 TRINITY_DN26519_c0_g8~~TRINITY_DN26519_c0_g8_i1.p1  ORF type:complete len:343 (+),score=39.43 TRINITY_DN26519_c0_g8_i1:68-1096(+)